MNKEYKGGFKSILQMTLLNLSNFNLMDLYLDLLNICSKQE
jgi:hypothetical protein